ncbi:MAG: metallophosphoesterase [Leptospiraceae bacterium]|nr:metallophosphoesterase [Leptospiraceae bacterium]
MKIIHISDLHIPTKIPFFSLQGKMFSGYFNYILRRKKLHPIESIQEILRVIKSLDYDILILSGDITNVAHEIEFKRAREILNPILDEKVFVVPGNHDRYTDSSINPKDLYHEYFGEFSGEDIGTSNFYLRKKIISGKFLLGWDTNKPLGIGDASGHVPESCLSATKQVLESLDVKSYFLIGHHPLWAPNGITEGKYHRLTNKEEVLKFLNQHRPDIYFHGHKHVNWIKRKDEQIPFTIINSASSTRIYEFKMDSGFHYFDWDEDVKNVRRYSYKNESKKVEEIKPEIY